MKIENNGKKLTPQERYDKDNTRTYAIKVVKTTEPDIFEKLENEPNKSGYIKRLIREDLNFKKEVPEFEEGMTDYQFRAFLILIRSIVEKEKRDDVLKILTDMIEYLED